LLQALIFDHLPQDSDVSFQAETRPAVAFDRELERRTQLPVAMATHSNQVDAISDGLTTPGIKSILNELFRRSYITI
jgi:hypothetical protein